jgi:hypothetical protein
MLQFAALAAAVLAAAVVTATVVAAAPPAAQSGDDGPGAPAPPGASPAAVEPVAPPAPEPRSYAYLFFQGRITDLVGTRPLAGASVRLESGGRAFEARTDARGSFVFERLPVLTYDLTVFSPAGQLMEIARQAGSDDPVRTRFQVRPGAGDGRRARVRVEGDRVVVDVPRPATDWPRFWKQFGIFIGCAGLLAL